MPYKSGKFKKCLVDLAWTWNVLYKLKTKFYVKFWTPLILHRNLFKYAAALWSWVAPIPPGWIHDKIGLQRAYAHGHLDRPVLKPVCPSQLPARPCTLSTFVWENGFSGNAWNILMMFFSGTRTTGLLHWAIKEEDPNLCLRMWRICHQVRLCKFQMYQERVLLSMMLCPGSSSPSQFWPLWPGMEDMSAMTPYWDTWRVSRENRPLRGSKNWQFLGLQTCHRSNGSHRRAWTNGRTNGQTDGQTDGRTLPNVLSPCYAVDKYIVFYAYHIALHLVLTYWEI